MKKKLCKLLKIRESNDVRSIIILANYRVANKIYKDTRITIIKVILMFLLKITTFLIRIILTIDLPYECTIGENILLGHGGRGIVIHPCANIGRNVSIYHNVTIGGDALAHYIKDNETTEKSKGGVPQIGNGVLVGAGAVIIGSVKVGNNVKIGANAVVTKSIPNDSTVVLSQSKIISRNK